MNNQPKFKKGDRVNALGETAEIVELYETCVVLLLDNGMREYCPLSEIEPITSPTPDMLAIPDDHVWPVTSDNEVVIVDRNIDKLAYPELVKEISEYYKDVKIVKKSVDQELEDAAKQFVGEIEDMLGLAGYNGFIKGANWKAEQVANDTIEFISDTMGVSKESIINLYEIWQQSKNR